MAAVERFSGSLGPVLSGSTGQEPPVLTDSGATHSVSVPAIGFNSLHRHFVLTGVTSALFINGPFHVPIPSRHVVYRCQGAFSGATSRSLQDTPSNEDSRWVSLNSITYKDPKGVERTWESAERRTRPSTADVDGVGIVAILDKPTGKEIILQKQYRPPVDKVVIEVPAGLIDEGETPEQAAVRELKEETGYVGVVSETTPIMYNDPGFCSTNLRMVHVTIDMDLPENQELKPELEENEFIEVFTVPLANLWEECKRLEAEGYAIDARVGTFAEGILLAQRLKL
ncbi:hypothetical protein A9Z42_0077870 [Trichoderma parareesei]|uniref:Nudix hydrolase domain-containing protein n=1 Tax=Trichoderma parareesei TaxID=858221 RepID=A0A2H2ZV12_TRIPA|nr:hypothetical protein A9Z42_0077870 [Trichoderma parareesei]